MNVGTYILLFIMIYSIVFDIVGRLFSINVYQGDYLLFISFIMFLIILILNNFRKKYKKLINRFSNTLTMVIFGIFFIFIRYFSNFFLHNIILIKFTGFTLLFLTFFDIIFRIVKKIFKKEKG